MDSVTVYIWRQDPFLKDKLPSEKSHILAKTNILSWLEEYMDQI